MKYLVARSTILAVGFVAATLLAAGTARGQCEGDSTSQVAKAAKKACKAYFRAARRGGGPDLSRMDRIDVTVGCRDAAIAACKDTTELGYGDAFDEAAGSAGEFPVEVEGRCPKHVGRGCFKALFKEVASPGDGIDRLDRIERKCGDPIETDLGGACDGVTGNLAARTCLAGEISTLAAALAPPPPPGGGGVIPPVTPADCGFPGASLVKPVVPGAEFDAARSPWRRYIGDGLGPFESVADNASQMDFVTPSTPEEINLSTGEWTYPVYNIVNDRVADCPEAMRDRCFDEVTIEHVYLTKDWNPTGRAVLDVPVPAGIEIRPDVKADSHVAIVDWVHGIEYDFWACAKNTDRTWKKLKWPSSQGGDNGMYYACKAGGKLWLEGTGVNLIGPDSAKGSGFALTAGQIRPRELAAGAEIEHALAMSITTPASGGPVPPANLSDGTGPNYPGAPPEGARLQLRPSLWGDAVIDAQSWTDVEKKIARALRDYGAIISDMGGADIDFYAEGDTYDADMYDSVPGIAGGAYTTVMSGLPFTADNFQIFEQKSQYGLDDSGADDHDGDGMFTAFEIAMGWVDFYEAGTPANTGDDADADGLTNLEEQRCLHTTWDEHLAVWAGFALTPPFQYPCNPYASDSDHDGFDDPTELAAGTDPTDPCRHP